MTDQETIDVLMTERAYLIGKHIGYQEIVQISDPPEDVDLIHAIENAINYIKDYKNMSIQVEKLESAVKSIDRDRSMINKELERQRRQNVIVRSKNIRKIKVFYEDGTKDTIKNETHSIRNYTELQEGE